MRSDPTHEASGRLALGKLRVLSEVGRPLLLERVAAFLRLVGGVVQKRGVSGELLDARKPHRLPR